MNISPFLPQSNRPDNAKTKRCLHIFHLYLLHILQIYFNWSVYFYTHLHLNITYITGDTSKKLKTLRITVVFSFPLSSFRLSFFPLLSFSLVRAFPASSDLSTHASNLHLQYRGSYTENMRGV